MHSKVRESECTIKNKYSNFTVPMYRSPIYSCLELVVVGAFKVGRLVTLLHRPLSDMDYMYQRQDHQYALHVEWFGITSDNADLSQVQLLKYLGTPSGPLQTAEKSSPCSLPPNSIVISAE